jgi:hypothetical protein
MNRKTKRAVLLWIGSTFIVLGGAAFAVMRLGDPLHRVSTPIQPVVIEEPELLPLPDEPPASSQSEDVAQEATTEAPPPRRLPEGVERAGLVETDKPYWEVLDHQNVEWVRDEWTTLLIQNRMKLDYTVIPTFSRNWEWVRDGRKLKVQFHSEEGAKKDILSRKKLGKFAVQMISLPAEEFDQALQLVHLLLEDGHYAYLHRAEQKYDGKTVYRVRVGFYQNLEQAQVIGQEIFEKYGQEGAFSQDYWAVIPTSRELSRNLIDLQQPITKPWTIELPLYADMENALSDLPKFVEQTDFTYLSQRFDPDSQTMSYRLRVGFFETAGEARSTMYQLRRYYDGFGNGKIKKL